MSEYQPTLVSIPPTDLPELGDDSPLAQCCLLDLPIVKDHRGNLTFIEEENHVSFPIKRVYYLYDVPGGAHRGGHAHGELEEVIIAISGSFDVVLSDHKHSSRINLNRSYFGIYVGPMVWRELDNFSSGSVCLVLASAPYEEADYYRDREQYLGELNGVAR
jgi:hypothetical protein